MNKQEKEQVVSELKEKLNKASSIYLTDFSGLTVEQTNEFRTELFNAKVDYRVVKNTLMRKALDSKEIKNKFSDQTAKISEKLIGPTGVIFAYEDPVSPAKIIKKIYDKIEKPKLKVAFIENVVYDSSKLNELASLPTKQDIIASIIGSLQAPISGIINIINSVFGELASVIEEVAKKKENK